MKKILLSVAASAFLASTLSALSFKQDSLKLEFEGFKAAQMVGVIGTFKDIKYQFSKDTKTLASYLKNAKATINPSSVFMGEGNDVATNNIAKVFFPSLLKKGDIKVTFQNIVEGENLGVITAKITLDKKSAIVPLSYTIENNKFVAKGQLDLNTYKNGAKALKDLSDAAPGHGGISWPLVNISFSADIVQ